MKRDWEGFENVGCVDEKWGFFGALALASVAAAVAVTVAAASSISFLLLLLFSSVRFCSLLFPLPFHPSTDQEFRTVARIPTPALTLASSSSSSSSFSS